MLRGFRILLMHADTPVTRQGKPRLSNSVSPTMSEPIVAQPSAVGMGVVIASGAPTCAPFMMWIPTMSAACSEAKSATYSELMSAGHSD